MANPSRFELRPFQADDLHTLQQLLRTRAYPGSAFSTPESSRQFVGEALTQLAQAGGSGEGMTLKTLFEHGSMVGFILLRPADLETITHQPQTLLCDFHANNWDQFQYLMDSVLDLARRVGDHYLAGWNSQDAPEKAQWFQRYGFKQELKRVFKRVNSDGENPPHPLFRLRQAKVNDITYIMRTVAENSPIYCPAHRPVDVSKVQAGFVSAYTTLGTKQTKRMPLVLERSTDGEQMGYLILEPARAPGPDKLVTLYIYDLALNRGLAGLSKVLYAGAETLLARMGGGVFYGDISADNIPALMAQSSLGFELESIRWGYPVDGNEL